MPTPKSVFEFAHETSRPRRRKLDNLTRDSIAAERAGMSYGKYKAAHPHTNEPPEDLAPHVPGTAFEKVCPGCGNKFYTMDPRRKYCGDVCQNKVQGQRDRERKMKAREAAKCEAAEKE